MTATDNLSGAQWKQLPMYMTGPEIKHEVGEDSPDRLHHWHFSGPDSRESTGDMWDRKLSESRSRGLHYRIKKQGVKVPIQMHESSSFGTSINGHHRVASAAALDPKMLIPVDHSNNNEWPK